MFHQKKLSRRELLQMTAASACCFSAPSLIPATALGFDGAVAPSNRITVGMIGLGRQCLCFNLPFFMNQPDCEVVALCDVDRWRLDVTEERTASYYGEKKNRCPKIPRCPKYIDFREVLGRKDVDAVMISTPDHWHVPMSVMAVKAGKDVSCEKPLARSIAEGRYLSDLVTKHKRVFRTDSEFRAIPQFHKAVELVRNGRIGKLHTIRTTVPFGESKSPVEVVAAPPKELNYDLWQGPAPERPYSAQRVHTCEDYSRPGWFNIADYSCGMIQNWTAHLNDIAQWGNNTERTGPVEVEGHGKFPPADGLWNTISEFEFTCTYADGVKLICKTDSCNPHTRFEGENGWVQANFGGSVPLETNPKTLLEEKIGPNELHFPLMHEKRDFLNAVKTRGSTLEDAEVGHRVSSLGHLGLIAIRLGRKLKWDPHKEQFQDDDEANKLRSLPPGRSPWILEQL